MCVCVHTDQQSTIAPLLTLIQLFSLSVPTVSTSILLKRSEGGGGEGYREKAEVRFLLS